MSRDLNPTHYENIETFVKGEKRAVHAIIETPRNQRHKYAFDPKTGAFRQTMMLAEGLQWPYDYGFIPQTLAADGDSLDILYLGDEPTFTGCLVGARVVGIVRMEKNGEENDRILGCPLHQKGLTQKSDAFDDVDDIPNDTIEGICRYLVDYSQAEGNDLTFCGVKSRKTALKAIAKARRAFEKKRKGVR
ncbi:MAG TPA: inorganic diphosphatase [Candidatus Tumulicola sp.]|jgi:inorganic pyrophosphatase